MNKSDANRLSCDYWQTPVSGLQTLWLSNQLYTGSNNYFFFENGIDDPVRFIYVLIIRALDAFKLSDESDSSVRIDKLLKNRPLPHRERARSYKIWSSPYALEASYRLGMTSKEYEETEKFQYVIVTQDVTIEFVTLDPPKWETYEGINLDDLVIQCLKKDSSDQVSTYSNYKSSDRVREYKKPGGLEQLQKDFEKIKGVPSKADGLEVKTQPNGTKIIKRPLGSESGPTLEVQPPKNDPKYPDSKIRVKVRYQ